MNVNFQGQIGPWLWLKHEITVCDATSNKENIAPTRDSAVIWIELDVTKI